MKTGIVILNYNSYDLTCNLVKRCLSMQRLDKIVIVDNHSNDNFDDFCNQLNNVKIKYIKNSKNAGYASGNNIGLKYLVEEGFEIGFIANPDTMFEEKTIENIVNFLKIHPQYGIASCKRTIQESGKTGQYWWIPDYKYVLLDALVLGRKLQNKKCVDVTCQAVENSKEDYLTVEVVGGAFFGCNLKIMEEINYLDEATFLWYEENILASKLKNKNYKEALMLNCTYQHNHVKKKGHGNQNFHVFIQSKRYFCNTYLKMNSFQKLLLKLFDGIGMIENKILCMIK